MKGVVFTTFFDHVRELHGEDWLDDLIDKVGPDNGGSYTRVGTYPFDEMVQFVSAHAQLSGEALPDILENFGHFCFSRWVMTVPEHFNGTSCLFDALCRIDRFHETEVKKLYPEAELPSFTPVYRDDDRLELDYRSCKPLADLAVGVIRGAAAHYGERVDVEHSSDKLDGIDRTIITIKRIDDAGLQ